MATKSLMKSRGGYLNQVYDYYNPEYETAVEVRRRIARGGF